MGSNDNIDSCGWHNTVACKYLILCEFQYEDILEQRKAIEEQKAETEATQERVEELYKEIKDIRSKSIHFL